jgi:hypothetical protein
MCIKVDRAPPEKMDQRKNNTKPFIHLSFGKTGPFASEM